MYEAYEQKVLESYSLGRNSTEFPAKVASELAIFAYRLAEFVAKEADLELLRTVVAPPVVTSAGVGVEKYAPVTNIGVLQEEKTSADETSRRREGVLLRFNNTYLELFHHVATSVSTFCICLNS